MKYITLLLTFVFISIIGHSYVSAQSCGNDSIYKLPYKDTYVKEKLVAENTYRIAKPMTADLPIDFQRSKLKLPNPIWSGHNRELEMYWKAWEIALRNIRNPEQGSGFIMPYIDTAYNGNIFMWDSSFILMFARYGAAVFNFQGTLDNFYAKQHPDGFICREIKADGADCFERYDPVSTGPNLMPWCEMVYYKQFGNMERLHKAFPVLCAYYRWLKMNRTWRNGTYWSSGWGTGMDNMPRVHSEYSMIYSHGHMVWLDTNLQQLFTANLLLEMGFYLERWQEIEELEDEASFLKKYIHDQLWDQKTGFLYDQYADGSLSTTKGIGAYWALYSDVLNHNELERLVAHLNDTTEFNRTHMIPSLSADNSRYKANGRYWQGGVWPGTNYMVINGLLDKGFRKEAYRIAQNHYNRVLQVFNNTGTFWEYYAPEKVEPGFMARKDFVGWTGLAPIAGLIEHIIGIRGDYTKKQIVWNLNLKEENGIERYPFGEGFIDLRAKARKHASDAPKLQISSPIPFDLIVNFGDQTKEFKVKVGNFVYE